MKRNYIMVKNCLTDEVKDDENNKEFKIWYHGTNKENSELILKTVLKKELILQII